MRRMEIHRRQQCQVVAVAEVADAEHAPAGMVVQLHRGSMASAKSCIQNRRGMAESVPSARASTPLAHDLARRLARETEGRLAMRPDNGCGAGHRHRQALGFDKAAMTVDVEPGIVRDALNAWLEPHAPAHRPRWAAWPATTAAARAALTAR